MLPIYVPLPGGNLHPTLQTLSNGGSTKGAQPTTATTPHHFTKAAQASNPEHQNPSKTTYTTNMQNFGLQGHIHCVLRRLGYSKSMRPPLRVPLKALSSHGPKPLNPKSKANFTGCPTPRSILFSPTLSNLVLMKPS